MLIYDFFLFVNPLPWKPPSFFLQDNRQKKSTKIGVYLFLGYCILDKITCSPQAFIYGQIQPHMSMW